MKYHALIVCVFCYVISVLGTNIVCESKSEEISNKNENLFHQRNHENIKGVSRGKRNTKPATAFFDELLGQRLFNTTMNFIVPGAKVHLPRHTKEGSVDHLAMQAFFGIFWAAAWLATIAIPVSHTYFRPLGIGRSIENENDDLNLKWKLNKKFANKIGLDWQDCLQKAICQAHSFPEKYGGLGTLFRLLFPVDEMLKDSTRYKSRTFHPAASNGAIGQDCGIIYKCFFDTLDVIQYVSEYCFATLSF